MPTPAPAWTLLLAGASATSHLPRRPLRGPFRLWGESLDDAAVERQPGKRIAAGFRPAVAVTSAPGGQDRLQPGAIVRIGEGDPERLLDPPVADPLRLAPEAARQRREFRR